MPIEQLKHSVLNLLYPPRCPICQELAPAGRLVCPACLDRLPRIGPHRCQSCGRALAIGEERCLSCAEKQHYFTAGRGAFRYEEPLRESLVALKYHGKAEYARGLGALAYAAEKSWLRQCAPFVLVPVPLHEKRQKIRGYNQAALLADALAGRGGFSVRTDLLFRAADTVALKELSRTERFRHLQEAFFVPPGTRLPSRIMLVDDIYTTGATIDACAAVLREAGARTVFFLTLCIGSGDLI